VRTVYRWSVKVRNGCNLNKKGMTMKRLLCIAIVTLAGCASINSGAVPVGNGSYLLSRQAATAAAGTGTLKVDAIAEARAFCAKDGKSFVLQSSSESTGPYLFGNYPKAEIQFACA
jgi:hypothetical protein